MSYSIDKLSINAQQMRKRICVHFDFLTFEIFQNLGALLRGQLRRELGYVLTEPQQPQQQI